MDKWINFNDEWFNLDDFCHIWIEARTETITEEIRYGPISSDYTYNHKIIELGYYLMGEWRHNGEEVIISQEWDSKDELRSFVNRKLTQKNQ